MKRMKCILILFLLVSLIHSDNVSVNADDSGMSTASEEENELLCFVSCTSYMLQREAI